MKTFNPVAPKSTAGHTGPGRAILFGGSLAVLLGGCAIVTSQPYSKDTNQGIVYSLPKQLVKISVVREQVDFDDLLEAVTKQQAACDAANKTAATAKAKLGEITELLENTPDEAAKKKLQLQQAIAKATWEVADLAAKKSALNLDQAMEELKHSRQEEAVAELINANALLNDAQDKVAKLEEAIAEIKALFDKATDAATRAMLEEGLATTQCELAAAKGTRDQVQAIATTADAKLKMAWLRDTIAIEVQPPVPDPRPAYTFIAEPRHNILREDTFKLSTSPAGLLEGYKGSADDKTGEALLKVVDIYSSVAGASRFKMSTLARYATRVEPPLVPFKYERMIDPTDSAMLGAVANDLTALGARYRFEMKSDPAWIDSATIPLPKVNGLYYRRPMLQTLEVYAESDATGASPRFVQSFPLLLPNQGPIAFLDIEAAAFVKSDFDFVFKDGMLISFDSTKPSGGLALFSLISDTAKGLVAIPAEILQLKIDYSSKEQALAENQKAALEAKVALLEAQQAAAKKTATLTDQPAAQP